MKAKSGEKIKVMVPFAPKIESGCDDKTKQ